MRIWSQGERKRVKARTVEGKEEICEESGNIAICALGECATTCQEQEAAVVHQGGIRGVW